jgi:hypothetical protein
MEGTNGAEKDVRKRRMVDATRRRRMERCEWERERCRVMVMVMSGVAAAVGGRRCSAIVDGRLLCIYALTILILRSTLTATSAPNIVQRRVIDV